MRRIGWHFKEEEFLVENYATLTIKELIDGLFKISNRTRTADSINAKIKRLKYKGKINESKTDETVYRALTQRRS